MPRSGANEESFGLKSLPYPEKLRQAVWEFNQPTLEVLDGTLELAAHGDWLTTTIEKLLPAERRYAILRTGRPIGDSDIQVVTDPTLFLDQRELRTLKFVAFTVVVLWLWVKVRARRSIQRA